MLGEGSVGFGLVLVLIGPGVRRDETRLRGSSCCVEEGRKDVEAKAAAGRPVEAALAPVS